MTRSGLDDRRGDESKNQIKPMRLPYNLYQSKLDPLYDSSTRRYLYNMEHEIVLAAVAILTSIGGAWALTWPLKQPRPPISSKAKTGYWYFGLGAIGLGLGNLFFGFRDGQMWWMSKGAGNYGWLPYAGYKWQFVYLGFVYSSMVFMGLLIIRLYVLGRRENE